MTSRIDVASTRRLLEELQATVREFISKERILRDQHQSRRTAVERDQRLAQDRRHAQAAEQTQALQAELARRQAALQETMRLRLERVEKAAKASRKRLLETIEQKEGRLKYAIQKRSLESERQWEKALSDAAQKLEQLQTQVKTSQEEYSRLTAAARRALSGVPEFRAWLGAGPAWPEFPAPSDEYQILDELDQARVRADQTLVPLMRNPWLRLFRVLPLWIWIVLGIVGYVVAVFGMPHLTLKFVTAGQAAAWVTGAVSFVIGLYYLGKRMTRPAALEIAGTVAKALQWHELALRLAEQRRQNTEARLREESESSRQARSDQWQQILDEVQRDRAVRPGALEAKRTRIREKLAALQTKRSSELDAWATGETHRLQEQSVIQEKDLATSWRGSLAGVDQTFQAELTGLKADWEVSLNSLRAQVTAARDFAEPLSAAWTQAYVRNWTPPSEFEHAVPFGTVVVNLPALAGISLQESALTVPGGPDWTMPLILTYPDSGSLLIETGEFGGREAVSALNAITFRMLGLFPSGKLGLTLVDPTGLGQNFAGLMHLADYEEGQLHNRILTQPAQIEERLGELTEHMEKVIQMYLRNEYATIADYNAQAGTVAEKYHLVVIAGFPTHFSETSVRRLLNIASSGARCGVFTLIQWDLRAELPHGSLLSELRQNSVRLAARARGLTLADLPFPGIELQVAQPPPPEIAIDFLRRVGANLKSAARVELPFSNISPSQTERWTLDAAEELRVPIGRTGATKRQYLVLGKGTRQHVLIAGKTGSGKSTLFHVLITNLALWYAPDQVEFYLVDFKKGVEFKAYANRKLPHARVVAIESDREFALSVLQRVDDELRLRGDMFRKLQVQDLEGYRRSSSRQDLPRLLLMIDEFQEFFTEEDRISQTAAVLLDRIVRQGRAFGVHVLLGSQTLGGAYSLARATMGQMVVRIALQCNEADAYLIMDEGNAAPRLLSRPGEGIYNDMAGAVEGNSPFQTAWLSDEARDGYLAELRGLAEERLTSVPQPFVFEGNAPAVLTENRELMERAGRLPMAAPPFARIWLGAPNSIKGPTEVQFPRQSGSHLLVVGQSEDAAFGIPALALLSLSAQYPAAALELILVESTAPGSMMRGFLDRVTGLLVHPVLRPKRTELPVILNRLVDELSRRTGDENPEAVRSTFLIITNLQELKTLRPEDEFGYVSADPGAALSPAAALMRLIAEGPGKGIHVIASIDTYNDVSRFLGRKGLSEFQNRVLFQMSASDSASLIDTPEAGRLGLHRALLYQEREGYLEKFRPYTLHGDWASQWTGGRGS